MVWNVAAIAPYEHHPTKDGKRRAMGSPGSLRGRCDTARVSFLLGLKVPIAVVLTGVKIFVPKLKAC